MLPLGTQSSLPHSSLEYTLVSPDNPPSCPRVKSRDAALQARVGDILYVFLLVVDYILFGVYQDWVHQNLGNYLDGRIKEDGKWKAKWQKTVCMPTHCYNLPYGNLGEDFS